MHPASSSAPAVAERSLAFAQLVRAHERTVYLSLLAKGLSPKQARELTHETWAYLYVQWCSGRLSVLSLPGLAIAQATFLALRAGRPTARHVSLGDEPQAAQVKDPVASVEQRLEGRQALAQVAKALEACPPRARSLFEAAYEEPEVPHAELASRHGVSVQRFRQALCEVRARLRRALGGER